MMLIHLALLALAQTGKPPASVIYSNPGARLELLLPQLSKACGLTLVPDKKMRDVVLTLRLDNAPTAEAMEKIAYAARGKWSKQSDGFVLHLDADGFARDEEAAVENRRAKLARMLAYMMTALEPRKLGADQLEPTPANIAVAKLLPSLDIPRLYDTDDWPRLVFSTDPKPLQMKLGEGAGAIFDDMVQAIRVEPAKIDDDDATFGAGVPFRTNLCVEHINTVGGGDWLSYTITVFDRAGAVIGQTDAASWDPEDEHRLRSARKPVPLDQGRRKPMPPLTISPRALSFFRSSGLSKPPTPEIRDVLIHPLTQDPNGFMGDIVLAYAERKHLQVAAALTDEAAFLLSFGDFTNEEDVWEDLKDNGATVSNGWLTIARLEADTENSSMVMNRRKLQKFVDSITDEAHPKLAALVRADRLGLEQVQRTSQAMLYPNLRRQNSDLTQTLALLTDDQIRSLLAGDRIALVETPTEFQEQFAFNCFEIRQLSTDNEQTQSSDKLDPTELVSSKVPANATIALERRDIASFEERPDSSGSVEPMDLHELANSIVDGRGSGKYKIGLEHTYELKCYLAPGIYWSAKGSVYETPANAPYVTPGHFPAALQSELNKLIECDRREIDEEGKGKPPPPR